MRKIERISAYSKFRYFCKRISRSESCHIKRC
nr:MAG TPA: hypothetical protein [Caudoviricetes sp.]